ncbi:hypothetical protein C0995_002699 [Termitomyces sp. Mi166|nr:hypothetical protein C0995_002699 [Termitomyces sp. Mi166\
MSSSPNFETSINVQVINNDLGPTVQLIGNGVQRSQEQGNDCSARSSLDITASDAVRIRQILQDAWTEGTRNDTSTLLLNSKVQIQISRDRHQKRPDTLTASVLRETWTEGVENDTTTLRPSPENEVVVEISQNAHQKRSGAFHRCLSVTHCRNSPTTISI